MTTYLNERCERLIKYIISINRKSRSRGRLAADEVMKMVLYAKHESGSLVYMYKPRGISETDTSGEPIEIGAARLSIPGDHLIYLVKSKERGNETSFDQAIYEYSHDMEFDIAERLKKGGYQDASIKYRNG